MILHHPYRSVQRLALLGIMLVAPATLLAANLSVRLDGTGSSEPCPAQRDSADYGDIASAVICAEPGDEISVGAGTWTGPDNRDLAITKSLVIRGAGAALTILDAAFSGRHILASDSSIELSLIGMTLRNGLVEEDASNWTAAGGSVLFTGNTLNIADCRFEDNAVRFAGGGSGFMALGGAVAAGRLSTDPGDQVRITDSVFLGNTVHNPDGMMRGAAIVIEGYVDGGAGAGLVVERSSFYDNRSLPGLFQGGAVVFFASFDPAPEAFARISNTFIASHDGANHTFGGSRGKIEYSTLVGFDARVLNLFQGDEQVTAVGTMFVGIGSEPVCTGTPVVSEGHNLDTDASCGLGDPTGLSGVAAPGVTLSHTSDGVPFMSPAIDSPAVDAGPVACEGFDDTPLTVDQLRQPRPRGAACDIGAIEFDARVAVLHVEPTGTATAEACPTPRDAVDYADIASAVACAYAGDEIAVAAGNWTGPRNRDLLVDKSLLLRGAGSGATYLNAHQLGRHFEVSDPSVSLAVEAMTLHFGRIEETDPSLGVTGGSILFSGKALTIRSCRFEDNRALHLGSNAVYAGGGAIAAVRPPTDDPGAIHIVDSTFLRNNVESPSGPMTGAAIAVGNYDGDADAVGLRIDRSSIATNDFGFGTHAPEAAVSFGSLDVAAKAVVTNSYVMSGMSGAALNATRADLQYSTLVAYNTNALLVFDDAVVTALGSMIVSFNVGGEACPLGGVVSAGYNLDSDGTCGLDQSTDLVAVSDPGLAPAGAPMNQQYFQDLQPDSPAIDAGAPNCVDLQGEPLDSDQIGRGRPSGAACDIGSIERLIEVFADGFDGSDVPP